jgi:hypothetical protein
MKITGTGELFKELLRYQQMSIHSCLQKKSETLIAGLAVTFEAKDLTVVELHMLT